LSAALLSAQPTCVSPPTGLVAWWRAEGNASDSVDGASGVIYDGVAFAPGRVGQAFAFNGTTGAINVPDAPALMLTNSLTVEGWLYVTNAPVAPGMVIFRGDTRSGLDPYYISVEPDGSPSGKLSFVIWGADNINAYISRPMPVGAWTHVAATLDGATGVMKLYTNAVPAGQITTSVRPLGPLDPAFGAGVGIGNHSSQPGPFNYPFRGLIDELSLYNRALSAAEIQAIYNVGGAGKCLGAPSCAAIPPGLVSWWPGESSTADAADGNNGTVAGYGSFGYGPGVVGQAFVFDGLHRDRVDVGNPINLQLQDFTIEAWIKRSSATDISLDDNNQDGAVAGEGGLVFSYGRGGYGLGLLNDGHLLLSKIDVDGVFSTGVVADTNWHHVAVAKSGSTTVFYIDGASASAGLPYTTSYTFDTSASIGSRGDVRGGTFYGSIDEPSVYNRALSAAEVQAIYLASSTGKCRTPAPPSIVTQPMRQTAFVGDTVRFAVEATGDAPLSYQWRFNGLALSGQTAPLITVTNVQLRNAGNYSVLVTNVAGSVASSNALLTVNARPECAAAPAGLVSWWPGEDSTADAAVGNNGTVAGYGSFDYGPGMVGLAFVFDGLHRDRVDVGNPTNLQLQDFTIEAWIKRASAADISLDDENQDGAVAGQGGLVFSYGRGGYGLGLLNDGRLLLSRIDVDGVFSTGVVADTNWHHVAVAKSGSTTVFYVDGASASAGLPYATSYTFDTSASIGSRGDARGGTFYGSIDEASVYNRALPAAEIQTIYRASVAGKCRIPSCAEVGPLMALVDGSNLARASQQALRASLDAACASLDRGALAAALNQLAAFQNKVNALVAPFDSALAATLTQTAQQVIDALGPRRPGGHAGVKFHSVTRRADGRARLSFVGAAGQAYLVEASTNLTDWEVIGVAGDRGDGSFDFEDTDAWRFFCRFYRIVSP
jgi:hypothetical protein